MAAEVQQTERSCTASLSLGPRGGGAGGLRHGCAAAVSKVARCSPTRPAASACTSPPFTVPGACRCPRRGLGARPGHAGPRRARPHVRINCGEPHAQRGAAQRGGALRCVWLAAVAAAVTAASRRPNQLCCCRAEQSPSAMAHSHRGRPYLLCPQKGWKETASWQPHPLAPQPPATPPNAPALLCGLALAPTEF